MHSIVGKVNNNAVLVYEASLHHFNNKPIMLFITTYNAAFL